MADTTYNLLDDDGLLYAVQYIFTKLKTSPLSINSTYALSLDTTNERIVLTDDQGQTSYVSYSDFGEANVLEGVKVNGTELTIDANKKVNIPLADATSGSQKDGVMSVADKSKLDGIAAGAQVNTVTGAQIDGTDLTITSKKIQIPNAAANTRGVVSNADINTLIQTALTKFERISFQKVNSYADLPVTGQNGVIYLVPNGGSVPNIYDEYIWYTNSSTTPPTSGYENIGTTAVDLSGYVQYTDINLLSNQDIADIVDDAYDAVWPSN